jgi:hypothetical protein
VYRRAHPSVVLGRNSLSIKELSDISARPAARCPW